MRYRFDPWVGKIPWRRKWQPTPVFLPGKSQGQRSLMGHSPWGFKVSDTTSDWTTVCILRFIYFNWRMIALQNFVVSVKHQQESAIGKHMSPSSWTSLPSPSPSYSGLSQSPCLSSLSLQIPIGYLFYIWYCKFPCYCLQALTLSILPSPCVHKAVYVSPLLPCKSIHQYHLSRFHIYVLVYDISLSDLFHSV